MRIPTLAVSLFLVVGCLADAAEPVAKLVVEGLASPTAVALRPESDEVFVAEGGAGRIVRVAESKAVEVIGGFAASVLGEGATHETRPLGLHFLDKNTLLVGGGSPPEGPELLRVFDLTAGGDKPQAVGDAKVVVKLSAPNEPEGPRHFLSLAVAKDAIFLAVQSLNQQGWISRGAFEGNKLATFIRYLPGEDAAQADPPLAMCISPRGYLVTAQPGTPNVPKDSVLRFYHPRNKKLLLSLPAGLFDITDLAYSEKTGQLYATDVAWMATNEGGLFQLIAGKPGAEPPIEARRVVQLDKPTALGFGKDGVLYVTLLGAGGDGGRLLKFDPGL